MKKTTYLTFLASTFALSLAFTAPAWCETNQGVISGFDSAVADDGSVAVVGDITKTETNTNTESNTIAETNTNTNTEAELDTEVKAEEGSAAALGTATNTITKTETKTEFEIEAEEGSAAAFGGNATNTNVETEVENNVLAEEGSVAALGNATNTEVTAAEGDVAANGGNATKNEIELGSLALNFNSLEATVTGNSINANATSAIAVATGYNEVNCSFGGASGITQVGQQSGVNSLQQQNVNVQSSLSLSQ